MRRTKRVAARVFSWRLERPPCPPVLTASARQVESATCVSVKIFREKSPALGRPNDHLEFSPGAATKMRPESGTGRTDHHPE